MGSAAVEVALPAKITVCGGGNGAQTLAAIAADAGCEVDIYAPYADEAVRLRAGRDHARGIRCEGAVQAWGRPRRISAVAREVIPGSEIVFLVAPAFTHAQMLDAIIPHLDPQACVGALPARGGFDWVARAALRQHGRSQIRLFGLQTLPWSCRIAQYGVRVHVLGRKKIVDMAAWPRDQEAAMQALLQKLLGLPIGRAGSFLALTLANVGQLIHPGIMYHLFRDWQGATYQQSSIPLFYQSLDEQGAEILQTLSDEIQLIRASIEPHIDLSAVRPLHDWLLRSYGADIADPSTLRSAFTSNRAYAGLRAPMREQRPGVYVPDFQARYLAEDVPYGLATSRGIAQLAAVTTPMIDRVLDWAGGHLGLRLLDVRAAGVRTPQNYGLLSIDALLS